MSKKLTGLYDFVTKAKEEMICCSCRRTIKKGEYVGYITLVPFCLKEDCFKETKRRIFYADTDSIKKVI